MWALNYCDLYYSSWEVDSSFCDLVDLYADDFQL